MIREMNIRNIKVRQGFFLAMLFLCLSISALKAQEEHLKYEYKGGFVLLYADNLEDTLLLDNLLQSIDCTKAITDSLSALSENKISPSGWELIQNSEQTIVYRKPMKAFKTDSSTPNFFFEDDVEESNHNYELDVVYGINNFKGRMPSKRRNDEDVFTFKLDGKHNYENVFLSGSFNNWSTMSHPMHLNDGVWSVDVKLDKGKNLYKFIVDGKWMIDPKNEVKEEDWGGNKNSVFYINNFSFELENYDEAKKVFVAGSFNGWNPKGIQMEWKNGKWVIDLYLRDGTYSYKFIVDGEWILDPANPKKGANEYGSENSLISLGKQHIFRLATHKNAQKVILTGDFNDWDEGALSMKKVYEGWEISVAVRPGNYNYKFIVDGQWITDPDNPVFNGREDYINSVICIDANHTFILEGHENAQEVFLSGSFNNWAEEGYTMQKENGKWILKVHLPKGKTRYKFIVDGKWIIDTKNPLWEKNEMDSNNSILWIK